MNQTMKKNLVVLKWLIVIRTWISAIFWASPVARMKLTMTATLLNEGACEERMDGSSNEIHVETFVSPNFEAFVDAKEIDY